MWGAPLDAVEAGVWGAPLYTVQAAVRGLLGAHLIAGMCDGRGLLLFVQLIRGR